MRAVVQRVLQSGVEVNSQTVSQTVSQIDKGLLVYLSVGKTDTVVDAEFPRLTGGLAEVYKYMRIYLWTALRNMVLRTGDLRWRYPPARVQVFLFLATKRHKKHKES